MQRLLHISYQSYQMAVGAILRVYLHIECICTRICDGSIGSCIPIQLASLTYCNDHGVFESVMQALLYCKNGACFIGYFISDEVVAFVCEICARSLLLLLS